MHTLITAFKRIGLSGKTIDGRTIKPEWLHQAAANYSPETYTALIWWEHYRFYNFGKVIELESRDEENGKVGLYAKLAPNHELILLNKEGQKLFTSMEITFNFDDTGEAYLEGLAVTDSPASLGTDELRFNKRKQHKDNLLSSADVEFALTDEDLAQPSDEEGFMKRIAKHFGLSTKKPDSIEEETDMNKEQFAQFTALMEQQAAAITTMGETLDKFSKQEPKPKEQAAAEVGDETTEPAEFSKLQEQFTELKTGLDALTEKLNKALTEDAGSTNIDEDEGGDKGGFKKTL
jgi:hypothetical protein